jgi:cytoskeletal protein RodZ
VRQHFHKLAMIVIMGGGFALAQGMPQQQQPYPPSSSPQGTSPQSTSPQSPSTIEQQQQQQQQQPSTAPDQGKTPETLPNTDQPKKEEPGAQKLPQSDAAPAATGDVQSTIQTALQKDPTLASANITVEVKDGKKVELSGTVPTKDAKDTAERIAKENSGGLKVKNHLKVASAENPAAEKPKTDMSYPKL